MQKVAIKYKLKEEGTECYDKFVEWCVRDFLQKRGVTVPPTRKVSRE